jgi:hypothetical protein
MLNLLRLFPTPHPYPVLDGQSRPTRVQGLPLPNSRVSATTGDIGDHSDLPRVLFPNLFKGKGDGGRKGIEVEKEEASEVIWLSA